jgi:hypothetical protein
LTRILHPHDEIVARDAAIVDEDVELSPQRLDRRGHQCIDCGTIRKVARQSDMVAAEAIPKRLQFCDIGPGNRQPRALCRKRARDRGPNPPRSARHQRGHACKVEHYSLRLI